MGVNVIKSHMLSEIHKSAVKGSKRLTVPNFFAVTSNASSAATTTTAAGVTASSTATTGRKQRAVFGSNATLQAEVLWCLNTAAQHHTYASNEGVSELFQAVFPDSEIAKSFTCGKDKTSCILKFGLAPHFKDKLLFFFMKLSTSLILSFEGSFNTCCSLSHGQATVERGFSVNREVETCNIKEETVEAQRLVCDQVKACGGILKVSLTKELLASVASARTRYRIYLDEERRNKEGAMCGLKRKALEDELGELKKKKAVLTEVCASLQKDADQLAEKAENKSGTLMAQMITKSKQQKTNETVL